MAASTPASGVATGSSSTTTRRGGDGDDVGNSVALTTNSIGQLDKIVVVGYSDGPAGPAITGLAQQDLAVWRLNSNGTLDTDLTTGFGPISANNTHRQGYLTHHNAASGSPYDEGNSIALTTNSTGQLDKIVIAGSSYDLKTGFDLAVWRLNTDGSFDTSFGGGDGIFIHHNAAAGNAHDFGQSVALTTDNAGQLDKIVVVGGSDGPGSSSDRSDLAVWRLNADGSLDTSFGGADGFFTHHNAAGGNSSDVGNSVALTTDSTGQIDKILVAGYSSRGPVINGQQQDLVVWRLNANGSLDPSFGGGDGFFTHHNAAGGNGRDEGYSVALTTDSTGQLDKIVVAGYSKGGSTQIDLAVWRLNANGALDTDLTTGFGPGHQGYLTHHNAAGGNSDDVGKSVALTTDSAGQLKIVVVGDSFGGSTGTDLTVWRLQY